MNQSISGSLDMGVVAIALGAAVLAVAVAILIALAIVAGRASRRRAEAVAAEQGPWAGRRRWRR